MVDPGGSWGVADEDVEFEDLGGRNGLMVFFAGLGIGWERRRE